MNNYKKIKQMTSLYIAIQEKKNRKIRRKELAIKIALHIIAIAVMFLALYGFCMLITQLLVVLHLN